MPGKARPSLRHKTLENVERSNLSITDKKCIATVFMRYEQLIDDTSDTVTVKKIEHDSLCETETYKARE